MKWHLAVIPAAVVSLASVLVLASCSHTGSGGAGGKATGTGTGASSSTGDASSSTGTAGMCTTNADCNGGVCNLGTCCATAADVCGATCCTGGQVCLTNTCVTPGANCQSAGDCPPGQYCETALGSGSTTSSTSSTGTSMVCSEPVPSGGKCLPLPAICDANGQPPGCVPPCEYHPPPGPLNAVAKWKWGPTAAVQPQYTDVWSTPVVGRVYDTNCDGKIDELDAPSVIVVSGNDLLNAPAGTNCQSVPMNPGPTMCHTGVLRLLDGRTGKEIWTLDKPFPGSVGFAGSSVALGDIDGDGKPDIAAMSGEGYIVVLDRNGTLLMKSDVPIPNAATDATFGWGGGLAIADMDGDGAPEIAYGSSVYTTTGGMLKLKFHGAAGIGGDALYDAISTFADIDGAPDNHLELVAGHTAYKADGTILWNDAALPDGFVAVGDFKKDGNAEVALVAAGKLWILDGKTGAVMLGPLALPGTGQGGPPTIASFDGTGTPEIGVAMATFYSVLKPDFTNNTINVLWKMPNHDLSSSVTGSTVFDFEGQGKPSVIYADECFLWVFDGLTGAVRFAAPHTSFTGTEASLVADVDGDGHAEILMITNGADPSSNGWGCMNAAGQPDTINGVTWTPSALPNKSYRGLVAYGDSANSWVGTRTLWSEHTYHVSNICDDRDSACAAPNVYGSIPKVETKNWSLPWLNNFRQNVQDKGLFDAPDPAVTLAMPCAMPLVANVSVRNLGLASLPAGVNVGVFVKKAGGDVQVGAGTTPSGLFPGQTAVLVIAVDPTKATQADTFYAKLIIDPMNPTFHECNTMNDQSADVKVMCAM